MGWLGVSSGNVSEYPTPSPDRQLPSAKVIGPLLPLDLPEPYLEVVLVAPPLDHVPAALLFCARVEVDGLQPVGFVTVMKDEVGRIRHGAMGDHEGYPVGLVRPARPEKLP